MLALLLIKLSEGTNNGRWLVFVCKALFPFKEISSILCTFEPFNTGPFDGSSQTVNPGIDAGLNTKKESTSDQFDSTPL